jgi:hypothetical protein
MFSNSWKSIDVLNGKSGNISKAHLLVNTATKSQPLSILSSSSLNEEIPSPTTSFSPSNLTRISNRTLELYGDADEDEIALSFVSEYSTNELDRQGSIGDGLNSSAASSCNSSEFTANDPDHISIEVNEVDEKEDAKRSLETLRLEEPVYLSQNCLSYKMPTEAPEKRWHLNFIWRVDFQLIKSILNPVPLIYPLTLRYAINK